jgi:DNA-binding Xre family transcriptional regulator
MIVVKLREAMEAYRRRTGERMTYAKLSALTGISQETLRSIGSRLNYRPTLGNVEKLCRALDVPLHDMLDMIDDPPKPKRKRAGRSR